MKKFINYREVALIPRLSNLHSRDEASTSLNFLGRVYKMPIVPANMVSVINEDVADWLAHNEYFYIMHRFCDVLSFVTNANKNNWPLISISVGVKNTERDLILQIKQNNLRVDVITIDIAHGYSILTANMIKFIKKNLPDTKIIAGNVWGDYDSILYLESLEVDAIKIGLSCGRSCTTFTQTGFGSPMFSAALEAGEFATVPVIIDGGVRENADVTKAIVAFLSAQSIRNKESFLPINKPNIPMIMIGSMMAACIDSPAEAQTNVDKSISKKFYGSASEENKKNTGQAVKNVEGQTVWIECNYLTYAQKYNQMKGALQSSISYAGGVDLTELKDVKWGIIT